MLVGTYKTGIEQHVISLKLPVPQHSQHLMQGFRNQEANNKNTFYECQSHFKNGNYRTLKKKNSID